MATFPSIFVTGFSGAFTFSCYAKAKLRNFMPVAISCKKSEDSWLGIEFLISFLTLIFRNTIEKEKGTMAVNIC